MAAAFGLGVSKAPLLGAGTGLPASAGKLVAPTPTQVAPASSFFAPGSNSDQVIKNTTGFQPSGVAGVSTQPGISDVASTGGYGTSVGTPAQAGSAAPPVNPYTAALESDPAYAAASNDATLAASEAGDARTAAVRQAILQYGGLPSGFTDTYGDADAATLAAAKANPYSELAQNQLTYNQGVESDRQALAARGMDTSGATPVNAGNENNAQGLALYNLANQFGSTVNTAIGNYTGALDTNRTNLANALATAETDEEANPAYAGLGTTPTKAAAKTATSATTTPTSSFSPGSPTIPDRVSGSSFVPPRLRDIYAARTRRDAV